MRTGREMLLSEDQSQNQDQHQPTATGASTSSPFEAPKEAGFLESSVGAFAGGGATSVIPIAPHRRLRQAVLLAQKLLRKEGELEAAKRGLAEVQHRWVGYNTWIVIVAFQMAA